MLNGTCMVLRAEVGVVVCAVNIISGLSGQSVYDRHVDGMRWSLLCPSREGSDSL